MRWVTTDTWPKDEPGQIMAGKRNKHGAWDWITLAYDCEETGEWWNDSGMTIDPTHWARVEMPGVEKEYARPRTRGELRTLLKHGTPCEVAEHVAESTTIMLHCWLEFNQFTVRASENIGWVVFEPATTPVDKLYSGQCAHGVPIGQECGECGDRGLSDSERTAIDLTHVRGI